MRNKPKIYTIKNGEWSPNRPENINILIRWATTAETPMANVTYNLTDSIRLASDKAECRRVLGEAGIPVPVSSEHPPCVGRTRKHRRGSGFWYCETDEDVLQAKREGAVYFSAFYPKTEEYRVHVAHGRALAVSEKIGNRGYIIWNKSLNDFRFENLRWKMWPRKIVKMAIQSCEAIGLDYGAVDVLAKPRDYRLEPAVVCEINTSPMLGDYISRRYGEYFDWLLEADNRRYHLDNERKYIFKEGRNTN